MYAIFPAHLKMATKVTKVTDGGGDDDDDDDDHRHHSDDSDEDQTVRTVDTTDDDGVFTGVPQPNKWINGKLLHWDRFFGYASGCH